MMLGLVRTYESPALTWAAQAAVKTTETAKTTKTATAAQGIQHAISAARSSYRHAIMMDSRHPSGSATLGSAVRRISDVVKVRETVASSGQVNANPAEIRVRILAGSRSAWRAPVHGEGRSEKPAETLLEDASIKSNTQKNPAAIRAQILAASRAGWRVPTGNAPHLLGESLKSRELTAVATHLNPAANVKVSTNSFVKQRLDFCFSKRSVPAVVADTLKILPQEMGIIRAKVPNITLDEVRRHADLPLLRVDSAYGSMENISHREMAAETFNEVAFDGGESENGMVASKFDTFNFSTNLDYYKLACVEKREPESESEEMWWDDFNPWFVQSSNAVASRNHLIT